MRWAYREHIRAVATFLQKEFFGLRSRGSFNILETFTAVSARAPLMRWYYKRVTLEKVAHGQCCKFPTLLRIQCFHKSLQKTCIKTVHEKTNKHPNKYPQS